MITNRDRDAYIMFKDCVNSCSNQQHLGTIKGSNLVWSYRIYLSRRNRCVHARFYGSSSLCSGNLSVWQVWSESQEVGKDTRIESLTKHYPLVKPRLQTWSTDLWELQSRLSDVFQMHYAHDSRKPWIWTLPSLRPCTIMPQIFVLSHERKGPH